MKRRTKRTILTVVCCVLICGALMTLIGKWTNGSYDLTEKLIGTRNENNLLTLENYTLSKDKSGNMSGSTRYGISYTVKDDGRIVLSGKNTNYPDDVQYVPFASVTLDAGTYTLTGYENAGMNTLGVYAEVNGTKYRGDMEDRTFTITQTTTVVVGFYVYNDVSVTAKTLYPTLVSGEDAGSFYTKD